MENIGEWIQQFPDAAPGIILGAVAGVVFGAVTADEGMKTYEAWGLGGLGAAIGAFVWIFLVA